jgi:hypothetical protein
MRKNLTTQRLTCIAACRADLLTAGIDLARMTPVQRDRLVALELEYFQLMLGE